MINSSTITVKLIRNNNPNDACKLTGFTNINTHTKTCLLYTSELLNVIKGNIENIFDNIDNHPNLKVVIENKIESTVEHIRCV